MEQFDLLIVEDDASLAEALSDTLDLAGYSIVTAANGLEALEKLSRARVRLVISDVQMQKMDGLTLLDRIKAYHADIPVLLMTAYGSIEKAVQAMRKGAVDYLVKPFSADVLLDQVANHIAPKLSDAADCVVVDPAMQQLFAMALKVANSDATVLIQGESGTGKEVLARFIHHHSERSAKPFVAINCAAIPENMLEAELFGHEKGAFTGALQTVPGRFELAQGGTLLLDEISEMALPLQSKLLRVIQEREMERVGGRKTIRLDVRILATTNRDIQRQVAEGGFREDLYYRLSVFPLRIPALRERPKDILPLAKALLQKRLRGGKKLPEFSDGAVLVLQNHAWPGNVRELENVVQRGLILHSGDKIQAEDLGLDSGVEILTPEPCKDRLEDGLRSVEEKMIIETLRQEMGSRKATAEKLGISERTLRYKIAKMRESGAVVPG